MKTVNPTYRALLVAAVIAIFCGIRPVVAQDAALPDATVAQAGLDQLPDDLRARWLNLRTEVDSASNANLISEGELTIKQLGELILAVGGQPPAPGTPSYAVYSELQNKLVSLLDRVELALALNMPDEALNKILAQYEAEKQDLSVSARSDRQHLLEEGTKMLKGYENDPYFLKYPHRREVLASLYFRMTELLYAETYDDFLEATDAYFKQLDSLRKSNPSAASSLRMPQADYSRVMAMYQRIVDEFPASEFADDALYNLAFLYASANNQTDRSTGNALFETLVKTYPESAYRLNSLRRIGEFYFQPPINDLEKSAAIYQQIADEFKDSEYLSEAYYKLGWCYYRMSTYPQAVEYFAKALDVIYKQKSAGDARGGVDIANEAIKYICICYASDPRDWKEAGLDGLVKWLNGNPERLKVYGRDVVMGFGDVFHNQLGRHNDGVRAYQKYLEMFPNDPKGPVVQQTIAEIYQQGEIYSPQATHTEKLNFYLSYNPDSEWWKVNNDAKLHDAIVPTLEKYLDLLIDEFLILATDSKDQRVYTDFEKYSRQYLRFWPRGAHAYKIHYNLASALERMKDHDVAAIREYWVVATAYTDTTYRDISCQRAVAIAQQLRHREVEGEISLTATGETAPPAPPAPPAAEAPADTSGVPKGANKTPLLNSDRLLLASFDLYLSRYPQSRLSTTMLYNAGDILAAHDWFPESREYLEKLIANYDTSKYVEDAYKLVLEGYFKSKDFRNVEAVSARIAAAKNVSPDLKKAAKRRKSEAVFLAADDKKIGNDHAAAAEEYKRVAIESPDYQYADRSLWFAGVEYMQAKMYKEANDVFTMIADRYPKSEFADKALNNVAFNLQSQSKDMKGSAAVYERLATAYPKSDLAQAALSNASVNYTQIKDDKSAIRVNTLYVQLFPNAEDASIYMFENAAHYMSTGEVEKANEIYRQFAQRYPNDPRTVQACFERGKFALEKKDQATASKEFTTTLETHQKLVAAGKPGSPKYASKALAHLLSWEQAEYEKLRFTGGDAQVKTAKDRKKTWRNALVDKYQTLIKLGQKEAYGSFYAIGRLLEDFALATYEQEVPKSKDFQANLDNLTKVTDEAILANIVAQQSYETGFKSLLTLVGPLHEEQAKRHREYDDFTEKLNALQKDSTAVGVADSLTKQTAMQRGLADFDSATVEASIWLDSCRHRIPEVAFKNGKYLTKLWYGYFGIRSNDKNDEVRLLVREGVVKDRIAPVAAEIVGYYMQAWNSARDVGLAVEWRRAAEQGYQETADSLLAQYAELTTSAQKRVNKLVGDFETILPKGEDGKTSQGFYSDEMGGLILAQVDYLKAFDLDLLVGLGELLDTVASYNPVYGFGEAGNNDVLSFVLAQADTFSVQREASSKRQVDYSAIYEKNSQIQYDDAQVAFEDISTNCRDYSLMLLDSALSVRQKYAISGDAGVELVKRLVAKNPDKYAALVGLSSESRAVVTANDWLIWPKAEPNFQDPGFNDSEWKNAHPSSFPLGVTFPNQEKAGAVPIWYNLQKPSPSMGMRLPGGSSMLLGSVFAQDAPDTTSYIDSTAIAPDTTGLVQEVGEQPIDSTNHMPPVESAPASEPVVEPVTAPASEQQQAVPATETPAKTPAVQPQVDAIPEAPASPTEPPSGSPTAQSLPDNVGGVPSQSLMPKFDPIADSLYKVWMLPDSVGTRRYWFRKGFEVDQAPSAGRMWVNADDDFNLFLNGVYVAEDRHDEIDWTATNEYNVLSLLKVGHNEIAIEAWDVDSTRHGLVAALQYEFVPDMSKQLESLGQREADRDLAAKKAGSARLAAMDDSVRATFALATAPAKAVEPEVVAATTEASAESAQVAGKPAPSPDDIRDFRIIIKNRLR